MGIPQARKLISEVIANADHNNIGFLDLQKLHDAIDHMYRRHTVRVGRSSRPKIEIGDEQRSQIKALRERTDYTQSKIAFIVFGDAAHSGRVSEVLHNLR